MNLSFSIKQFNWYPAILTLLSLSRAWSYKMMMLYGCIIILNNRVIILEKIPIEYIHMINFWYLVRWTKLGFVRAASKLAIFCCLTSCVVDVVWPLWYRLKAENLDRAEASDTWNMLDTRISANKMSRPFILLFIFFRLELDTSEAWNYRPFCRIERKRFILKKLF